MLEDWNIKAEIQIWMDATAGMAIGQRRGLGKVKHIDTTFLWVQEIVNQGRVRVGKKGTKEMLADMFTKAISAPDMVRHMEGMCFKFEEGRSHLGLNL